MQNTWQQSQEFVAVYTFSSISEMSAPYFRCLLGAAGTIFSLYDDMVARRSREENKSNTADTWESPEGQPPAAAWH